MTCETPIDRAKHPLIGGILGRTVLLSSQALIGFKGHEGAGHLSRESSALSCLAPGVDRTP